MRPGGRVADLGSRIRRHRRRGDAAVGAGARRPRRAGRRLPARVSAGAHRPRVPAGHAAAPADPHRGNRRAPATVNPTRSPRCSRPTTSRTPERLASAWRSSATRRTGIAPSVTRASGPASCPRWCKPARRRCTSASPRCRCANGPASEAVGRRPPAHLAVGRPRSQRLPADRRPGDERPSHSHALLLASSGSSTMIRGNQDR